MSHILHLGHQPTDIAGIGSMISTDAAGFDAALDVNGIRISTVRNAGAAFSIAHAAPAGDLWLGFRYVPPSANAGSIAEAAAGFLEFYDAANALVGKVRPVAADDAYHAEAHGDAVVLGPSSYIAPTAQAQWIDVRVAVGAEITVDFLVGGVLQSTATAANAGGKGKPAKVVFPNYGLHDLTLSRTWYFAHIAILDGVSTIGRRFVRRTPGVVGAYAQMAGSLDALKDADIATRMTSDAAGQRLSFSLAGPTGPAAGGAIAGVHLKAVAQAGTDGPEALAGFLRIGGTDHDAAAVALPRPAVDQRNRLRFTPPDHGARP